MTVGVAPEAIRLLEAQLTRMRGMIYRYYELFFRFTNGGLVATGALFVFIGRRDQRAIEAILAEAYGAPSLPDETTAA